MNKEEVKEKVRVAISQSSFRDDIRKVSLFGSYASGTPRPDSDVDQKQGSKLFRGPGAISFSAIQFEQGADPSFLSTIFKSNNQQIGTTNWGCGSGFRNGQWHQFEIYLLKSTAGSSNGLARIWTDDQFCWEAINQNTDDPQGAEYWDEFHMMSNWSISEVGWDHDAANHIYWDEFEIYSDTGTGGTGSLSTGTVTQGGSDTTAPAAPTGLGVQ